jgi:hypothetical protein
MALQADSQGFLQGAVVSIDYKTHARAVDVLKSIKGDTQAIRKALTDKQMQSTMSSARVVSPKGVANQPVFSNQQTKALAQKIGDAVSEKRPRDSKGRFVKAPTTNNPIQAVTPNKKDATPSANKTRKVGEVATPERGANGRFLGKGGESSGGGKLGSAGEKLSEAAEELKTGLGSLTENTENIDPAIAASKEAIELVTPVLAPVKAVGALFSRDKNEAEEAEKEIAVPWYRRITDQLKKLNNKGDGGGKGIFGSMLGGLGKFGAFLTSLPLIGGALGKFGGIIARLAMFVTRLTPIGLVLTAAGALLYKVAGSINWTEVGNQIKAKWDSATETMGALWDSTVQGVSSAWDATTTKVGELFKPVADFMTSTWSSLTDTFNSVITGIGDIFSSVGTAASDVVSSVKNWFSKKAEGVKETYGKAKAWAGEKAEAATIATGRAIGKLKKDYRHKESFEGIAGGEGLAKNGTYTNDEADRIRQLKSGNFNTGVGKGLTPEMDAKITKAALEAGLSPEMMKRMAMMESGGNANAISSTGAIGLYQFTGGTATGVGIENRFDVDQNIAGAMKLTQQNKKYLESKGVEATPENLYMMHQQGATAVDIIKGAKEGKRVSDLTAEQQKALSVNYGYKGQDQLLSDYYERNTAKLASQRVVTSPTSTMTASASMPSMPNAPAMTTTASAANSEKIAISAVPTAKTQVSSDKSSNQVSVTVQQPIGQNMSDRSIAQVATGGIGGYGRIGV